MAPPCARRALDAFYRFDPNYRQILSACARSNGNDPYYLLADMLIHFRDGEYNRSIDDRVLKKDARALEQLLHRTGNAPDSGLDVVPAALYWGMVSLWQANRNQMWAAGRAGKRMFRALKRLPREAQDCSWAWFLRGCYHYFAARVPGLYRFLGKILGIPGGDRWQGLAELEAAAYTPSLFQVEAMRTLVYIYLFFERDYDAALAWVERLLQVYPQNLTHLMFAQRAALHASRWDLALHYWKRWFRWAVVLGQPLPEKTAAEAIYWNGRWLLHQGDWDGARLWFHFLLQANLEQPAWLPAWTRLSLAQSYDLAGDFPRAYAIYRELLKGPDSRDMHRLIRWRFRSRRPLDLSWTNY